MKVVKMICAAHVSQIIIPKYRVIMRFRLLFKLKYGILYTEGVDCYEV